MPPDNADTVVPGSDVSFPNDNVVVGRATGTSDIISMSISAHLIIIKLQ